MQSIMCHSRTAARRPVASQRLAAALGTATLSLALPVRTTSAQRDLPPIQTLERVIATTTTPLQAVASVRVLSNGAVIVNDPLGLRLVMFDPTLSHERTILDSSNAGGYSYGAKPGGLLAYHADTTMFVDPVSLSMLVIDPAGRIMRVMALPRGTDANDLIGGSAGLAGFDPGGRLIYRNTHGGPLPATDGDAALSNISTSGGQGMAPLVRVRLRSPQIDTLALIAVARPSSTVTVSADGDYSIHMAMSAMPTLDDWVLFPDGSIAIVRGRDFHIEWASATGNRRSSPALPFEWQRLSLDQREDIVDSARTATSAIMQQAAATLGYTKATPRRGGTPPLPQIDFTPATELAGYRPAFYQGLARPDSHARVWIRTTLTSPEGPVYDVVDSTGAVVARVRLPDGRVLLAVARDGALYMGMRDTEGVTHVEKALPAPALR